MSSVFVVTPFPPKLPPDGNFSAVKTSNLEVVDSTQSKIVTDGVAVMEDGYLTNLHDPVVASGAATKNYVDNAVIDSSVVPGTALSQSVHTLNVNVDGSTITVNGSNQLTSLATGNVTNNTGSTTNRLCVFSDNTGHVIKSASLCGVDNTGFLFCQNLNASSTCQMSGLNIVGGGINCSPTVSINVQNGNISTLVGDIRAGTAGTGNVSGKQLISNIATGTAPLVVTSTTPVANLVASSVTTNANLTGPITSVGNATSIASQTGTGTTFVMSSGPTLTGSIKVGNAPTDLVGFYGKTPIVQPTTSDASATYVAVGGTNIQTDDTFDGYTIAQIVRALRNLGELA